VETWIIRIVAILCATGSSALFWVFGVFVVTPWREARMLALSRTEFQVIGASLLIGIAVAWGALHIFALADRETNPRVYVAIRAALLIASVGAMLSGMAWLQARIA